MRKQFYVILFLSFALSGCVNDVQEDVKTSSGRSEFVTDSETESSLSYSPIELEFELKNETKIIRFETDHEDGIQINTPPRPEPILPTETEEDWTIAVFILGGGMSYRSAASYDYHARVNDQTVNLLTDGATQFNDGWRSPGPNLPGDHIIAFHAENANWTFRISSKSAIYEFLENETMNLRHITQNHPDWERETHIEAPHVQHFHGSIEIKPLANALDVHGHVWGENPRMSINRGEGYPLCTEQGLSVGAHTDQSANVSVSTQQYGQVHSVNFWIVDWSLEQKNNMCWSP